LGRLYFCTVENVRRSTQLTGNHYIHSHFDPIYPASVIEGEGQVDAHQFLQAGNYPRSRYQSNKRVTRQREAAALEGVLPVERRRQIEAEYFLGRGARPDAVDERQEYSPQEMVSIRAPRPRQSESTRATQPSCSQTAPPLTPSQTVPAVRRRSDKNPFRRTSDPEVSRASPSYQPCLTAPSDISFDEAMGIEEEVDREAD